MLLHERVCVIFVLNLLKDVIEQSSSIVDNKKEVLTSTNKKIVNPIFSTRRLEENQFSF